MQLESVCPQDAGPVWVTNVGRWTVCVCVPYGSWSPGWADVMTCVEILGQVSSKGSKEDMAMWVNECEKLYASKVRYFESEDCKWTSLSYVWWMNVQVHFIYEQVFGHIIF